MRAGAPPTVEALSLALDALVLAMHALPDVAVSAVDIDPPVRDGHAMYSALRPRFPGLGYHGVADPLEVSPPGEVMVGDAIDDLTDIVGDLEQCLWRHDNVGLDDALWHLGLLYRTHWGRHARELGLYLHALQFT